MLSDEETDSLNVTVESNDGSLYIPIPLRKVKDSIKSISVVPWNVFFMEVNQLNKFMKQINPTMCATLGCKGALHPVNVRSIGLGGAVSISYGCSGCAS